MATPPIPTHLSANGDSPFPVIPGIEHIITGSGTFGGGTVKLQYQDRANNWIDVIDASWSGNFEARFVPSVPVMRLSLSGSTTPQIQLSLQILK